MNSSAKPSTGNLKTGVDLSGTMVLLTTDNPVFCSYLFWCSVLIIKMLLMSLLTAFQRFKHKVFPNTEDLVFKNVEVQFDNSEVERVRRAHRNDLENILPFVSMALMFICTNPNAMLAKMFFRIGVLSRLVHTCVYAFGPVPQPARAIAFFITWLITIYMALHVFFQTIKFI